MRPSSRLTSLAALVAGIAIVAGACSSAATTPGATVLGATGSPGVAAGAMSITIGSTNDQVLGTYLTGQNGMTLYILSNDKPDSSTCSGSCATNWPPLTVASGATITGPSGATAPFGTITRSDGSVQVTYNHWPLYYYAADTVAGDTLGQGKLGVWFVAPLTGVLSQSAPASSAAAPVSTPAASASYGY